MTKARVVTHSTFKRRFAEVYESNELVRKACSEYVQAPTESVCFLTPDKQSGFQLVESHYELRHLFSLERGRGRDLINQAIELARHLGWEHLYLDCFDGYLTKLYTQFGFVETSREANWIEGEPDVVWMKLKL